MVNFNGISEEGRIRNKINHVKAVIQWTRQRSILTYERNDTYGVMNKENVRNAAVYLPPLYLGYNAGFPPRAEMMAALMSWCAVIETTTKMDISPSNLTFVLKNSR